MNYPDISRDPPRDEELAAWLASHEANRADKPDLARLRETIMSRAQIPLARLRSQPFWWDYAARWARPAVPMAIAASLALAYAIGNLPTPASGTAAEYASATLPILEDVLTQPLPEVEYNLLISRSGEPDALLSFALQEVR
ncbi:hypothetical protein BH23GEM6_BH23GEM6_21100 [soil metagenome]